MSETPSSSSDPLRELRGARVAEHRPWPRIIASSEVWTEAIALLSKGEITLVGHWGEPGVVHMAVCDARAHMRIMVVSLSCPDGRYPSVGRAHPPAIRLERAIVDLIGLTPIGAPDERPWLDHGTWEEPSALADKCRSRRDYPFLPVDGENLHQVPVGPVHAGVIEPGHFRFTADGETIVRLEERLGYAHKGVESLMRGRDLASAARIACRCSGDSTVAYGLAFSLAAESALDLSPPPRAVRLRALMAELERLANHLGDIGAICNDAAFAIMHAHCSALREDVLRETEAAFGRRIMMDLIVPGGVATDLDIDAPARILARVHEIRRRLRPLMELYDKTASLQDRMVGTGVTSPALVEQFGAGGYIGRASGRLADARVNPGYAPYFELEFETPVLTEGDVNARVWIRAREIEQSLRLIEQILSTLPGGPTIASLEESKGAESIERRTPVEGMALVESFRGDVLVWLRLDAERKIARCHLRDPSWFQWPLLEAAVEKNIIADFPLCNKSFNCSYSGHDL